MKIIISLSATAFVAGDRVAAEFDKNDWACGTVVKPTPTGYKVDFDYGETKLLKTADVRFLPIGAKKYKKPLTLAQVRALKPEKVAAKPAAKAPPVKKVAAVKAVKPKQDVAKLAPLSAAIKKVAEEKRATPAAKQEKRFVGSVVKSRFGDIAILSYKDGRKYTEYKWSTVSGKPMTGWLKMPMHMGDAYAFSKYQFVRMASQEEMAGGYQAVRDLREKKAQRKSDAYTAIREQDIKPGDVVLVKYRNATQNEAVLEVDYRAGKLAVVRQHSSAAEGYSKRRLLPVSICTKVADGGGEFDPNNPLYTKHNIFIPQFYKDGNKVAARRPRYRGFGF